MGSEGPAWLNRAKTYNQWMTSAAMQTVPN